MKDSYLNLVSGPLGPLTKKLGLPQPVELRRFDPADAKHGFLSEPILVVGTTPGAEAAATLLLDNGFDVHRTANRQFRYQGIVAGFDGAKTPDDLSETALAVSAGLKSLTRCARVVAISDAPKAAGDVSVTVAENAARNGVTGLVRSLAHEMRNGSTANGILLADTTLAAPSAVSALWFFLSAKSAYVSGQFLTIGSDAGVALTAEQFGSAGAGGSLRGKTTVVTGAARGIGAAIAQTLHRDGAHVYGVDVPAAGQALAATMNAIGGTAIQLDITAADAGAKIAAAVGEPIDILIHNAGITRDKLLANMDESRWGSVIRVNIESQLAINEQLTAAGAWGANPHVVSLASTSGIAGNRGQTNYAASKAAVIGMAAAAADEFARMNGSINAIAPGFIETDMTAKMPVLTRQVARRLSSLQQGGQPVDVAEAIAFLASDAASGINGHVLRVCGQNLVGA